MEVTDFFELEDFEAVLKNFPSRKNSHRHILLRTLRSYYKKDEDLNRKKTIPTDDLIAAIWGKAKDINTPKGRKKYHKSFSALKSGVNRILKQMHKKGTNPKGIRIVRGNLFSLIDEAKEDIIEQLSIKINALKMYLSKVETKIKRDEDGLSTEQSQDPNSNLYKDKGIEKTIKEMEDNIKKKREGKGVSGGDEEKDLTGEQTAEESRPDALEEKERADDYLAKAKKEREKEESVKPRDVKAAYLDAKGKDVLDRDIFLDVSVEEEDISMEEKEKKKKEEEEKKEEKAEEDKKADEQLPDIKKEEIKDEEEKKDIEEVRDELEQLRKNKQDLQKKEKALEKQLKELEQREKDLDEREKEIEIQEKELQEKEEKLEEKDAEQKEKLREMQKKLKEQQKKLKEQKKDLEKQKKSSQEELEQLKKELEDIEKNEDQGKDVFEEEEKPDKKAPSTTEETDPYSSNLGLKGIPPGEEINFLKNAIGDDFDELKRSYAKLVLVKGGTFTIGSGKKHETPKRSIELKKFFIGKYPVVNELFQQFVEKTGYLTDAEKAGYGWVQTETKWYDHKESFRKGSFYFKRGGYKKVKKANWRHPFGIDSGIEDKMTHPVVQVSYRDAVSFCQWVEAELPTEFQWEYAARAGTEGKDYPWGEAFEEARCNSLEAGFLDSSPVDKYEGNAWQIFDFCGNTWEWCANWYMKDYSGVQEGGKEPSGPVYGVYRTLRGGSWYSSKEEVRIYNRWRQRPLTWNNIIGFRVMRPEVREQKEESKQ